MASKTKRHAIIRAPVRKPQPSQAVSAFDALEFAEGRPPAESIAQAVIPPPRAGAAPSWSSSRLVPAVSPAAALASPTLEEEAARVARIGRTPKGDVRLSVNVARPLHTRLKVLSARTGVTVGEIIERWIEENTPKD